MADDTNGKPTPPKVRPLQPASEHHPKELSDSRARAETAAASRQPTDVPDIRHRIREVLTREIEIKRLSETFSTKPEAVLTSSPEDITADDDAHRSALPWREDTAPPASPIPSRPDNDKLAAEADVGPAKPIMNENGFQIFKPERPEEDPAHDTVVSQLDGGDDTIPKSVEPVPMGADAIEEALKLIGDDHHHETDDQDEVSSDIGFIPANINPGTFGTDDASALHDGQDTDKSVTDDEQLINDILSEEAISADDDDNVGQAMSATTLHVVDQPKTPETDTSPQDKIQNWQIGHAMASSIRGIVKNEVDTALDKMARDAVREVLRAYR